MKQKKIDRRKTLPHLFKPGQSGNPAGSPKGIKRPKTKAWEELGRYIAGEGAQKYMEYLQQLDPKDYLQRFEAVLEYFKPKLARQELEHSGDVGLVIEHVQYSPNKISTDVPTS